MVLRHTVLLVEIDVKDTFSFTQCQAVGDSSEDAAFAGCSYWVQSWVPSAEALGAHHLRKWDQGCQEWGVDASDVAAVLVFLTSHSRHSYSPSTALILSLSSLSRAGVWLRVLRLLPVTKAASAKEPSGDLARGLQQGDAGHLISGKIPEFRVVISK